MSVLYTVESLDWKWLFTSGKLPRENARSYCHTTWLAQAVDSHPHEQIRVILKMLECCCEMCVFPKYHQNAISGVWNMVLIRLGCCLMVVCGENLEVGLFHHEFEWRCVSVFLKHSDWITAVILSIHTCPFLYKHITSKKCACGKTGRRGTWWKWSLCLFTAVHIPVHKNWRRRGRRKKDGARGK